MSHPRPTVWAMKILHTADWHVGRTIRGRSRADEHRAVLAEIVEVATRRQVDLVIVAGDQFDVQAPSPEAEQIVWKAMQDLAAVAPVVAIAGNHDKRIEIQLCVGGRREEKPSGSPRGPAALPSAKGPFAATSGRARRARDEAKKETSDGKSASRRSSRRCLPVSAPAGQRGRALQPALSRRRDRHIAAASRREAVISRPQLAEATS